MPRQMIYASGVQRAVEEIIPYLEDTSNAAHKAIYFGGWRGLAASAALRAIAENPPPSLLKKFNKIIHVDCSRWKSRRALQKTIAQELNLPQHLMAIFDKQDEEDDFLGIDEGSRAEIKFLGGKILKVLIEHRCLVVFHNGSNDMVNFSAFGIPQPDLFDTKVLWTFRGRLRLDPGIDEKVDNSHLFLSCDDSAFTWNDVLQDEAREIVGYTDKLGDVATQCCLYLLSLSCQGGNIMDYNWATHASSYWVCDGIIQGGHVDEAWEAATALHQRICIEDYSYNALPYFCHELKTPPKWWVLAKDNSIVHPESTSFFLASDSDSLSIPLPNDMFHQSENLHVLKLSHCTFNFSSPPFHCCPNLRFLGLDSCHDQRPKEVEKEEIPAMVFFKSLWVIDICNTNWVMPSSPEILEQMAANIREVHIENGRFWHIFLAWGQLRNLRKFRVIDPTCSWETGGKDEFTILPSLSSSTSLKTLVLDGCVSLELVEGLPPSLESFSLDARPRKGDFKESKISRISLVGCAKLSDFTLRGSLSNLEELDLSGTRVKTLDLTTQVVQVPCLQQIILLGCMELHAILWPEEGLPTLTVLHIDYTASLVQTKLHEVYVTIMDMRFFQSLVLRSNVQFCWKSNRFHLNLYVPCTTNVKGQSYMKKMGPGNSRKVLGPPIPKSLTPNTYNTYMDVSVGNIIVDHDYSNGMQFQPSGCHVEIGKGISNDNVESQLAIKAIIFAMNKAMSLHVHDNSSITTVIPEHMIAIGGSTLGWKHLKECLEHRMAIGGHTLGWEHLKQCHVVRCPKMHTVFTTNYDIYLFEEIETFWAVDLLNAHCIWSKGRSSIYADNTSFAKLRSIHLYSCPRLTFVLPFFWASQRSYLHSLESLDIVNCGDLKTVFPVHPDRQEGVLEFPSLKHIHLYELPKLQHICEVKMLAPKLERVWLRGCWSLRRLPAVDRGSRPVVDCEKDWWEKLEWDGQAGHDPCLFQRRHSSHYKEALPRVSVLR